MGQIVLSVDQAGVNQVFKALFNAMPAASASKSFGLAGAGGQFNVKVTVQAQPIDYVATAAPVDLIGSSQSPQIRIKPVAFRLVTDVSVEFKLGNWSRTTTAQGAVDVIGEAHAKVSASQTNTAWRTRLTVTAADVLVSLEPNRQIVQNAVDQALAHIDISPAPGHQPVPAALKTQLVNAAFDAVTLPIEALLTTLLKNQLGSLKADLVASLPKQWPLEVPGTGSTVLVLVDAVDPQVTANDVRIVVTFSVH